MTTIQSANASEVIARIIPGEPNTATYGRYELASQYPRKTCMTFLSSFFAKLRKRLGQFQHLRIFRPSAKPSPNAGVSIRAYRAAWLHRKGVVVKAIKAFKSDVESGRVEGLSCASWTPAAQQHFAEITSRPPELTMPFMLQLTARSSGKILDTLDPDRNKKLGANYVSAMAVLNERISFALAIECDLEASFEIPNQEESFQNLELRFPDTARPAMPATSYISRTFRAV